MRLDLIATGNAKTPFAAVPTTGPAPLRFHVIRTDVDTGRIITETNPIWLKAVRLAREAGASIAVVYTPVVVEHHGLQIPCRVTVEQEGF